jgi:hypothetical protein
MFNAVSILRTLPVCAAIAVASLSVTVGLTLVSVSSCGGSTHTPGDGTYAASVERGTRAPANALEEEVLLVAASETSTATSDNKASLGPSYAAASGRKCRRISFVEAPARMALVCEMTGGWKFVPEVFSGDAK